MVEQKMEKIAQYADKIILMHEGHLVDFGAPEEVFSRPDLESYGVETTCVHVYCQKSWA